MKFSENGIVSRSIQSSNNDELEGSKHGDLKYLGGNWKIKHFPNLVDMLF